MNGVVSSGEIECGDFFYGGTLTPQMVHMSTMTYQKFGKIETRSSEGNCLLEHLI
jgi:hypothetical protein